MNEPLKKINSSRYMKMINFERFEQGITEEQLEFRRTDRRSGHKMTKKASTERGDIWCPRRVPNTRSAGTPRGQHDATEKTSDREQLVNTLRPRDAETNKDNLNDRQGRHTMDRRSRHENVGFWDSKVR